MYSKYRPLYNGDNLHGGDEEFLQWQISVSLLKQSSSDLIQLGVLFVYSL